MVAARADSPILERARRLHPRQLALIGVALALATLGVLAIVTAPPAGAPVAAAQLAYPIPSRDGRVTVEVLNAIGRSGIAGAATRQLRRAGFDVLYFGNADTTVQRSRVLARRGDVPAAREVAAALGIKLVTDARDTLRRVDVSVWLGADFVPAPDPHP